MKIYQFSSVFANPTSLNKEEKGRMVGDTDAGDGVSVKKKYREKGNEKPPFYFSRVNVNDENKEHTYIYIFFTFVASVSFTIRPSSSLFRDGVRIYRRKLGRPPCTQLPLGDHV